MPETIRSSKNIQIKLISVFCVVFLTEREIKTHFMVVDNTYTALTIFCQGVLQSVQQYRRLSLEVWFSQFGILKDETYDLVFTPELFYW